MPIDAALPIALITPTTRTPRIESPHGGSITDLAVTADATAAVTSDDLGGQRLWPTLDGSTEPRVIELPPPAQLALGRDPKGFLIALIDEAGGLVLQVSDRDGALVQRATLPLEPAFKGVAVTERGVLAWRSDQHVVRLAADGKLLAELPSEQGQRVLHVAIPAKPKADRGIAVIEGSTDTTTWRRARWVELGDKLAWGAWIPAGDAIEPNLAVSPDLKRFAFLSTVANAAKLTVIDIANGKEVMTDNAFNALALEMPDADHAVYSAAGGQTIWVDLTTTPRKTRGVMINQVTTPGVLASGGGKTVNANGSELAISDPTGTSYLGYALQATSLAAAGANGQFAITWGDRAAKLDDKLHAESLTLFPPGHNITALRWLAGDEWLAQAMRVDTAQQILAVSDVANKVRAEVRSNLPAGQLAYEPSSKLVGVSFGVQPELYRYVGKRLESVAPYPKPPPYDRVLLYPVSPALANGTQVIVGSSRDQTTLRWVSDPRVLDKGPTIAIDGAVAAVDAAGKVYAWNGDGKGKMELAILRDGKRLDALALEPGSRGVWPDAKGERVLVAHTAGLTQYANGKPVWTKPIAGITHAVWLSDGAIAVITGLGIVRLDGATGEALAMRCGWMFELSPAPHQARSRIEPMCTKR